MLLAIFEYLRDISLHDFVPVNFCHVRRNLLHFFPFPRNLHISYVRTVQYIVDSESEALIETYLSLCIEDNAKYNGY